MAYRLWRPTRFRVPKRTARGSVAAEAITGLEWSGNESTTFDRRLLYTSPFAIYPATYIFRAFPKGPKNGSVNPAYWTKFFWGNNGRFDWDSGNVANTFYGAHPFPFDGNTQSTGQREEISVRSNDFDAGNDPPVWNRWYTQVFRASRTGNDFVHEYYWDWDLWVSSGGTQGMVDSNFTDAGWADTDPPSPCICIGQAPNFGGVSWGGYAGFEEYKGILRGFQLYDAFLSTADITSELAAPGSARTPWSLLLNPTVANIVATVGVSPVWDGADRPADWSA